MSKKVYDLPSNTNASRLGCFLQFSSKRYEMLMVSLLSKERYPSFALARPLASFISRGMASLEPTYMAAGIAAAIAGAIRRKRNKEALVNQCSVNVLKCGNCGDRAGVSKWPCVHFGATCYGQVMYAKLGCSFSAFLSFFAARQHAPCNPWLLR